MGRLRGTNDGEEFWRENWSIDTTSIRRRGTWDNIKMHLQ